MNSCDGGPHGECSEQMYKLYQLLKARGITLYNHFLEGWFFFDYEGIRYEVKDGKDGLRMVWTKNYSRRVTPYTAVEIATVKAVLD